jgi:hypothetical protein
MMADQTERKTTSPQARPAKKSKGQRVSRERGTATNHKKNPGKRAHKGGS